MAQPFASQGDDEFVGSGGLVKKVELVRIITDALYSLGYSKTGKHLESESGIPLHSTAVDLFLQQILEGQWDESVATLSEIGLMNETTIKLVSFVILEHKFLELLDGEKIMDALKTVRTEIAPLCVNYDRVRELSSFIVFPSLNLLHGTFSQESGLKSREKLLKELQKLLPPSVIIAKKRLVDLIERVIRWQAKACRLHNLPDGEMSLLTDHECGSNQIPSRTIQVLQEHSGEVWFLRFSHSGKFLASSSSDCLVIIWEVKLGEQVTLKHRLSGHQSPVSYISWSPDDYQLLTCGVEETVRRWDIASGECLHVYKISGHGLVSCEWDPDGKSIYTGVTDKSIRMWDLQGNRLKCWDGNRTIRISDLGITADGEELITVCKENTILFLGLKSETQKYIKEDQPIVSFTLTKNCKGLLVSLLNGEIHLWATDGCKLLAKYKGSKRSRFIVRSCHGGVPQTFVASGSEDSQVYIWRAPSQMPISILTGHTGSVNCVSWNSADPRMLASGSDDHTIRIWGLPQRQPYKSVIHKRRRNYMDFNVLS